MSVIELSASYSLLSNTEASMTLESNQQPGMMISLLHERYLREAVCYDFTENVLLDLSLRAGESLTIITRYHDRMIGSLVNEVDTCEESRILLMPKGGYNTIIYQSRLDDMERTPARKRALQVPTISTHLIVKVTSFLKQLHIYHNLYPPVFQLILPTLEELVKVNDEQRSREALMPLLEALEQTNLNKYPGLEILCFAMQERLNE